MAGSRTGVWRERSKKTATSPVGRKRPLNLRGPRAELLPARQASAGSATYDLGVAVGAGTGFLATWCLTTWCLTIGLAATGFLTTWCLTTCLALTTLWWTTFFIIGALVAAGVGVAVCANEATGARMRVAPMPMAASCFNIAFLRNES